ncbi:ADAM 17-like protease [Trichonephila clavipes]|nr:ADAM 17-like protease [Trichonephila clavipes]
MLNHGSAASSHYQLKYYEILRPSDIGHKITKRGIHHSSHQFNVAKEVSFKALGREFRLMLNPAKGLLSSKFKAFTIDKNGRKRSMWVDRDNFLEGRVFDGDRFNSCQVIYSQFGLAIHQNDHQARRRFVEWAQNEIAVVPDFYKRILFGDEAHFWLNGYVNKQNCRIWSEANPQVYVEAPLHPEKLTVWCALWAGGIIGPYFFKNDEGHNVTVNGDRYRAMITNFFIPELNNHDVQELWFQQDGATCHTARATIDLSFGDRLISRFGPVNWPPRSCDLTPLDYFLWGYVKSLVYADKPQTLDHLEDNIRRVIADIRPQMLEKVIENWTSRLDYIRASRGSPMPEIIFKM